MFLHQKSINIETIRKSITFTEKQDQWIKQRVESGDYTNDSEYIRDLVRKDQEMNRNTQYPKTAIEEGLQNAKSAYSVADIIAGVDNGEL